MTVGHGEIVDEFRAKCTSEVRGETQAWADEIIFDGGKAVADRRPLRAKHLGFPLVVNVVKKQFLIRGEVVIDTKQILAPRRQGRKRCGEAMRIGSARDRIGSSDRGSAAMCRIGEGNQSRICNRLRLRADCEGRNLIVNPEGVEDAKGVRRNVANLGSGFAWTVWEVRDTELLRDGEGASEEPSSG